MLQEIDGRLETLSFFIEELRSYATTQLSSMEEAIQSEDGLELLSDSDSSSPFKEMEENACKFGNGIQERNKVIAQDNARAAKDSIKLEILSKLLPQYQIACAKLSKNKEFKSLVPMGIDIDEAKAKDILAKAPEHFKTFIGMTLE